MTGCALVTGASGGIGGATAEGLARTGRPVVVAYCSNEGPAQEVVGRIETDGGTAVAMPADLSDGPSIEGLFDQAEERFGSVAVLVNNAGTRSDRLAVELSDDDWEMVMDLNLRAAFRCARRALRPMMRARFGRIVNVSSAIALRANPGQANYAASKAGLIAMTRIMAVEVARRHVTVNAVAPGLIPTNLTDGVPDSLSESIPARRTGTPEEVAACIVFLASDEASYVTGTTLSVDGGLSA